MSSDFSFGAMTPEINSNDVSIIERMPSKSHFIGPKFHEDQSIPSPPLSPYQSAESSAIAGSNSNNNNNNNNVLRDIQLKQQNKLFNQGDDKIDTIIVLSNNKTELREFPLDKYENYQLDVNAWSNLGTKNFKRAQINFIREYTKRSSSKRDQQISKMATRKYVPRRIVRSLHYDNDNIFASAYNSDSENSSYEKVRTRRLVRESSHALETENLRVSTPSPIKRRKPATTSPSVQPMVIDWESVPDFSPDVSLLPNNNKCLKVEWKGQPMSLADDSLIDKLHPAEVTLASILRLPCNLYLDSKRRLFAEKVSRMKKGLPFRRTDAQKSCRIDVNKASRLFAAFEKIGWLKDDKFEKYM